MRYYSSGNNNKNYNKRYSYSHATATTRRKTTAAAMTGWLVALLVWRGKDGRQAKKAKVGKWQHEERKCYHSLPLFFSSSSSMSRTTEDDVRWWWLAQEGLRLFSLCGWNAHPIYARWPRLATNGRTDIQSTRNWGNNKNDVVATAADNKLRTIRIIVCGPNVMPSKRW